MLMEDGVHGALGVHVPSLAVVDNDHEQEHVLTHLLAMVEHNAKDLIQIQESVLMTYHAHQVSIQTYIYSSEQIEWQSPVCLSIKIVFDQILLEKCNHA